MTEEVICTQLYFKGPGDDKTNKTKRSIKVKEFTYRKVKLSHRV